MLSLVATLPLLAAADPDDQTSVTATLVEPTSTISCERILSASDNIFADPNLLEFMPESRIQFQSSFEVAAQEQAQIDLWSSVWTHVGDWLKKSRAIPFVDKAAIQKFVDSAEFRGESQFILQDSSVYLATEVLSPENSERPTHWGLIFQHPDQDFPKERLWRTDLTVTELPSKDLKISITISYFPPHGLMMREIAPPRFWGAPVVYRMFSSNPELHLFSGIMPMRTDAVRVGPGQSTNFKAILEDKNRSLPILFVSRSPQLNTTFASRLAAELAGQAIVLYEDTGSDVSWSLRRDFLGSGGDQLIPENGDLMVYLPQFSFSQTARGAKNSLLKLSDLCPEDPNFYDNVRKNLSRISFLNFRSQGAQAFTIWDIWTLKRASRIQELRQEINVDLQNAVPSEAQNIEYMQELIHLYELELAKLQVEIDTGHHQNSRLQKDLTEAKLDLERLRSKPWTKEVISLDEKVKEWNLVVTEVNEIDQFTNLTAKLFSNKIIFSREALKSAKKLNFSKPEVLFHMLISLATDLQTILFVEKNSDYRTEFKLRSKYEISNEGGATRADDAIRRERTVMVDGIQYVGWLHLKYGVREPDMVRVYFDFDNPGKRIVVTHIATHLRTSSSGRNGGRRN